jgi:hypothetical protein
MLSICTAFANRPIVDGGGGGAFVFSGGLLNRARGLRSLEGRESRSVMLGWIGVGGFKSGDVGGGGGGEDTGRRDLGRRV